MFLVLRSIAPCFSVVLQGWCAAVRFYSVHVHLCFGDYASHGLVLPGKHVIPFGTFLCYNCKRDFGWPCNVHADFLIYSHQKGYCAVSSRYIHSKTRNPVLVSEGVYFHSDLAGYPDQGFGGRGSHRDSRGLVFVAVLDIHSIDNHLL